MRRLVFLFVVVAIVGLAAYGYTQGWYSFTRETDDHKTKIDITIDQDKIKEDQEKAKKKAGELESKVKDKAGDAGDKVKKEGDKP